MAPSRPVPFPFCTALSVLQCPLAEEEDVALAGAFSPVVKTHIPKIPKKPLMLGAAPESFMLNLEFHSDMNEHADSQKQLHSPQISPDPLPPIRTSHMEESAVDGDVQEEATLSFERQREQWKAEHELEQENVDSVFMTQVEEMPDSPGEPVDEDDISEEAKETCTPIPDIFRGYEELYYVDPDPYFIEPVGIRQNVKALEHALKHTRVCHEPKPRLQSIQKPCPSREKKVGKGESIPTRKNKAELLDDILTSMKKAKTYTQVPLALFLRNKKSDRKEYGEALMLLKEIQFRYHHLQEESAMRAKELETVSGNGNVDTVGARGQLRR